MIAFIKMASTSTHWKMLKFCMNTPLEIHTTPINKLTSLNHPDYSKIKYSLPKNCLSAVPPTYYRSWIIVERIIENLKLKSSSLDEISNKIIESYKLKSSRPEDIINPSLISKHVLMTNGTSAIIKLWPVFYENRHTTKRKL